MYYFTERPLLIYNTKFDIRQWFLITSAVPLTIWIYKDSYVRFSSQLYTLHKLHESIHLTNNSIQSRYKNCNRNPALPSCNMWDTQQFTKYLESIGHANVFRDVIYPGMKQCLTGAILMNQANLDTRKNCFELYGSDFMLTEDFKPWLIEINSRPALYPSTSVTARMCPQVLDDVIKVVIDYPKNPNASTGRFELLYKQEIQKLPDVELESLKLVGTHLSESYFYTPETKTDASLKDLCSSEVDLSKQATTISRISSDMKKTLENLLALIQVEREKRKRLKHRYTNTNDTPDNEDRDNEDENYESNTINKDLEIEVIKAITSDSKMCNSEDIIAAKSLTMLEVENSRGALTESKNTTKTLFNDIIESIKNLTFNYRSTNQT